MTISNFSRFSVTMLFGLAFASIGKATGYPVSEIPLPLLINANAVVREASYEFSAESPSKAIYTVKMAVTVLNENADETSLSVWYNKFRKIKSFNASLYNAAGDKIRDYKKNDIQDRSAISDFSLYEDDRMKFVDFSYGIFPYTYEYEYSVEMEGFMNCPDWFPQSFATSVQQSQYKLRMPNTLLSSYKTVNLELVPNITEEEGYKTFRFAVKNLSAVKEEEFSPPATTILPHVLFSLEKFKIEKYEGSMSTWRDFGSFYHKLNAGRDELSLEMQRKVKELIEGADSEKQIIRVLYNYLQQNMRYVSVQLGIGGWQTFDAQYVEKNKFGDCKALTNFMKAMLKEAGIEAYEALVNAGSRDFPVDSLFVKPFFNHVILYVPSWDCWLECTSQNAPINYLGTFTGGRNVLIVTPEGGMLKRTPSSLPSDNALYRTAVVAVDEEGAALISDSTVYSGSQYELYAAYKNYLTKEETEKKYLESLSMPASELRKLTIETSGEQPEAVVTSSLLFRRYASRSGKRLFIPFNVFNPLRNIPPENHMRATPIYVENGFLDTDSVVFIIPEGYEVESMPIGESFIENDFGVFSMVMKESDGKILYKRQLEIKAGEFPASRYSAYRQFFTDILKADNGKIVLRRKSD